MTIKNCYQKKSHLSTVKFREIIKYFCEDFSATTTANLSGISRNTINSLLRTRIVEISLQEKPELGEFELDESYFGAKRVRGKRGRGAAGKPPYLAF